MPKIFKIIKNLFHVHSWSYYTEEEQKRTSKGRFSTKEEVYYRKCLDCKKIESYNDISEEWK